MATSQTSPEFHTERDLARTLDVCVGTLRRWRAEGIGPRFVKLERSVRYPDIDFRAWLASRPSGGARG